MTNIELRYMETVPSALRKIGEDIASLKDAQKDVLIAYNQTRGNSVTQTIEPFSSLSYEVCEAGTHYKINGSFVTEDEFHRILNLLKVSCNVIGA